MSSVAVATRRRPCVVLGVAPASRGASAWAPGSGSGDRLLTLAGYDADEDVRDDPGAFLRCRFALDNLVPYQSPSREALRDAGELYAFASGFWYLLAGTEVVRALGLRALSAKNGRLPAGRTSWAPDPLEWYVSREGVVMAILPHPSGRNRWYNAAPNRRRAERFLRAAAWSRGAHASWERERAR